MQRLDEKIIAYEREMERKKAFYEGAEERAAQKRKRDYVRTREEKGRQESLIPNFKASSNGYESFDAIEEIDRLRAENVRLKNELREFKCGLREQIKNFSLVI